MLTSFQDYIPPEVLLAHQDALALMDLSSAVSPEPLHIEEDDMSNLDSRIDSWSLGVVLYEVGCPYHPSPSVLINRVSGSVWRSTLLPRSCGSYVSEYPRSYSQFKC